jgi:hypothetical protein
MYSARLRLLIPSKAENPMQIRAAVLSQMEQPRPYAQTRPIAIETVNLAGPGPNEVLVKITAAGLCHSDLSIVNGDRPRPMPMALGHEAAGTVEETGPGVTDLKRGDSVALVFVPSCGHCLPCLEGRPALCEPGAVANTAGTMVGGHRHLSRADGTPLNHQVGVSCFAEYAVCNRGSLVKVTPDLPQDVAAVFGCAVLTGVGAAINSAQSPARPDRGRGRPGRRRPFRRAGGAGRRRARGDRHRQPAGQARNRAGAGRERAPSVPTIPTWWRRSRPPPAAAWTSRSRPRARSRRSTRPTR